MTQSHKFNLTWWIILAIVLAVAVSTLVPWLGLQGLEPGSEARAERVASLRAFFEIVRIGGDIFLRLLQMMVVPLVIVSVMSGILGMGDVRKLGRPGLLTIAYYFSTTVLAVVLGLVLVNAIRPGKVDIDRERAEQIVAEGGHHVAEKGRVAQEEGVRLILRNLVMMMFTENLFRSAAESELLPLIVFSVAFAGLLTTLGKSVDSIVRLITQANDAILAFVMLLMRIAPLGIFCLVAGRFGLEMVNERFVETIRLVWSYSLTVLVGLALHSLVTLPLTVWFFTRRNPYRFMLQMSQALLTAFSTSSSSATLPVTMKCAIGRAGISRKSVDFVLPLGATINMDGTALYEAVAAVFIAQVLGRDLSLTSQIIVALTATLAAIGAAGIPEAGLFTMLIVLNAVGLPLEYQALIIPVDWLLDRLRTVTNVFGDACGAALIDRTFPVEVLPAPPAASPGPA